MWDLSSLKYTWGLSQLCCNCVTLIKDRNSCSTLEQAATRRCQRALISPDQSVNTILWSSCKIAARHTTTTYTFWLSAVPVFIINNSVVIVKGAGIMARIVNNQKNKTPFYDEKNLSFFIAGIKHTKLNRQVWRVRGRRQSLSFGLIKEAVLQNRVDLCSFPLEMSLG